MAAERPNVDALLDSYLTKSPSSNGARVSADGLLDSYMKSGKVNSGIKPVKRFNLPMAPDIEKRQAIAGPVARGVEAIQEGIKLKDLPYIGAKSVSGYLGGVPEIAARNPISGIPGAMMRIGVGGKEPSVFPEPATEAGKKFGDQSEIVSGFLPQSLPMRAGKAVGEAVNTGRKVAGEAVDRAIEVGKKDIPAGLKSVKREGLKQATSRYKVLTGLERVTNRLAEKDATKLKNLIKSETTEVEKRLNQTSRQAALDAQKALPQYFAKRSKEYGESLDGMIEGARNKGLTPMASDVAEALGETVKDMGLHLSNYRSPIEQEIESLFQKYSNNAREQMPISFEEILGLKKRIQGMVGQAKQAGTQPYGSGEHSLSSFKENLGKVFERYLPDLKKLNSDYAPFIKLKKQAVKTFKPFAGELETKSAENLLKRSGLPKFKGTAEDALIARLEAETGVPFSQQARAESSKLNSLKDARRAGLEQIKSNKTQRLIELSAKKNKEARNIGGVAMEAMRKAYRFGTGRIF